MTFAVGSKSLQYSVGCAATPNPKGISAMLYTTTPLYCDTPSVILDKPALVTWFPYRKDISAPAFTCRIKGEIIDKINNKLVNSK